MGDARRTPCLRWLPLLAALLEARGHCLVLTAAVRDPGKLCLLLCTTERVARASTCERSVLMACPPSQLACGARSLTIYHGSSDAASLPSVSVFGHGGNAGSRMRIYGSSQVSLLRWHLREGVG